MLDRSEKFLESMGKLPLKTIVRIQQDSSHFEYLEIKQSDRFYPFRPVLQDGLLNFYFHLPVNLVKVDQSCR